MPAQHFAPDTTLWTSHNARLHHAGTRDEVRIHYISCPPSPSSTSSSKKKGTILIIHGFPQTSHQFRHVITPLSEAGYHVLAPDYRGAGDSSKPRSGYTKAVMAADLHELLTSHLDIHEKVHVVGHDIGGMIAYAYASRFPDSTASVAWGECPLPGTAQYEKLKHDPGCWHFTFHNVYDLPELLVQGRERIYLQHFYERLGAKPGGVDEEAVEHYAAHFAKAGALRAGFDVYRAFEKDAEENRRWVERKGKCPVPALSLVGGESFLLPGALEMLKEVHESVETEEVEGSGHWIAEEVPDGFVKAVLGWVGKHGK